MPGWRLIRFLFLHFECKIMVTANFFVMESGTILHLCRPPRQHEKGKWDTWSFCLLHFHCNEISAVLDFFFMAGPMEMEERRWFRSKEEVVTMHWEAKL